MQEQPPPYFLTIGCMFKNEQHAICEWIDHYLSQGVEHIYLIDDGSTDASRERITPYLESNQVTLFDSSGWGQYLGRQKDILTHFLLPVFNSNQMEWLIICDMDEFLWSPHSKSLYKIFKQIPHLGQVQFQHTLFGSNGHVKQPPSILKGFTRRSRERPSIHPIGNSKYAIHNTHKFVSLNAHHASFANREDERIECFQSIEYPWFQMNHYCCQSREYWEEVKCTRGDSDNYKQRTIADFEEYDLNDVKDTGILL